MLASFVTDVSDDIISDAVFSSLLAAQAAVSEI